MKVGWRNDVNDAFFFIAKIATLFRAKGRKSFKLEIPKLNGFAPKLATLHCREYLVFTSHTSSFGWVAPSWVWHLLDWKTNIFRTIWNDEKKTAKHRESTAVGRSVCSRLFDLLPKLKYNLEVSSRYITTEKCNNCMVTYLF